MEKNLAQGIGRRKTSVARVYIRKGKGDVLINKRKLEEYFPLPHYVAAIQQPMAVTDNLSKYDVMINVRGGGLTGQAGACQHGLSRALIQLDENNRSSLKANGMLTRDSRMVERKKYGQPGARRKFQFSKR